MTMNLTELKKKSAAELVTLAGQCEVGNMARSIKQGIIFSIFKEHAKRGENIYGDRVAPQVDSEGQSTKRRKA